MSKKRGGPEPVKIEWNPDLKESWHIEFEAEAVNDEKWSCIVTAAIQSEAHDEECIQIYNQCAATGLRKAIKTVTMTDVVKLLNDKPEKTTNKKKDDKKPKKEKPGNVEKQEDIGLKPPPPPSSKILDLAMKYATFADNECKLPPDLMAGVLKYLILKIKVEHCFWKKVEAVKMRKQRQEKIKAKFIRDLLPYKSNEEEVKPGIKEEPSNLLGLVNPIDDEPFGGPHLYIMLIDFYNPFYFVELLRLNVPFIAIIRITKSREITFGKWSHTVVPGKQDFSRKATLIFEFWETLQKNCLVLSNDEKTIRFKEIAVMQYHASMMNILESKQYAHRVIFDELSWMQYSAYAVYRQHQNYLQQLYVQRLFLSLEPLDLSRCEIYNKLCDALVTGEPNTPCLIIYAMIEQVVRGVPYTESVPLEYEPQLSNFFPSYSQSEKFSSDNVTDSKRKKNYILVPPCAECQDKIPMVDICEELKYSSPGSSTLERDDWCESIEEKTSAIRNFEMGEVSPMSLPSEKSKNTNISDEDIYSEEFTFSESLVSQVLNEKKTEREIRRDRKWTPPSLIFYGDYVRLESYHCDPRIMNPCTIVDRFLKNVELVRIWTKYPELSPEERAFYNYHFFTLWKISNENQDLLKLKIAFALSMKIIGISKSYLYRGEEENMSEMFGISAREKLKKLSKVRFDQNAIVPNSKIDSRNFSSYFFKTFVVNKYLQSPRKPLIKIEDTIDRIRGSLVKVESHNLRKATSQFNMYLIAHRSSGSWFPHSFRQVETVANSSSISGFSQADKEFVLLSSLLDCFEISTLTECHIVDDKEDYLNIVQNFNFYENLESSLMIQRLLEAQENYNTVQCSHFAPTDTLILIMYNDVDYRGIFYTQGSGILLTPVSLRDFYTHVYQEIVDWLVEEDEEYINAMAQLEEEAKEVEQKEDEEFLMNLKKQFCWMSEEEKELFLAQGTQEESPIREEDLEDLPLRPIPYSPNRVSFVTTAFSDLRVSTHRSAHEFHSKDGTQVNVVVDSWLYEPTSELGLIIKLRNLRFIYYQSLELHEMNKVNTNFCLRTASDVIFTFYKEASDVQKVPSQLEADRHFGYRVKISWPTGLIIQGIPYGESHIYVKQGYLSVYRRKWDIEAEKARCFLKNGQVLIFKENDSVEILCGNGTKYSLHEFVNCKDLGTNGSNTSTPFQPSLVVPRYEITTACGEVWEKSNKGPCKHKKKLTNTFKIYLGVDPETQEIFYKRDDGVYCMLCPSGRLVTNFLDGTKITTTPDFDDQDIITEWTSEEKLYFLEVEAKHREELENDSRSRRILKTVKSESNPSSLTEKKSINDFKIDSFVSISCSYLMEHPKYASVFFKPDDPFVEVKMPEELTIKMHPLGNHIVQKEGQGLSIDENIIEVFTNCSNCEDRSIATINLGPAMNVDSREILCKFVDFFRKAFIVYRNGEMFFQDFQDPDCDEDNLRCQYKYADKSYNTFNKCDHIKNVAAKQRCFAFQRDLSGVEFLHADSLAFQCYKLPAETHFDLGPKSTEEYPVTHTFSSPYYRVGYENWVMDYEVADNSLPTNIKKKDLKEVGVKDNSNKLFKYPFPKTQENVDTISQEKKEMGQKNIEMPKVIVTRIIHCLSPQPKTIIQQLEKYISVYQKRTRTICSQYKRRKAVDKKSDDGRYDMKRLQKIALTLNQNFNMYPHICTEVPSTELDIHYHGHYINLMETFKPHVEDESDYLPDCKQIPQPLPRDSNLATIMEEQDSVK